MKTPTPYTVHRIQPTQWTAEHAQVHVQFPHGGAGSVDIYGPGTMPSGRDFSAKVTWDAIGSVSAADALAYAGAIALAASIAPTLSPATGEVDMIAKPVEEATV